MADLDRSMAPGCYGIGLLYRIASLECSTCPFATQCGPVAELQLARLRAEMGIMVPLARAATAASPTAGKPLFSAKLPGKVQELVDKIERAGIKVCEALARGSNPFSQAFPMMYVTCHLLIKRQAQGVTRQELAHSFKLTMKICQGTADAYVLQAIQALKAIGAAEEKGGYLRVRA